MKNPNPEDVAPSNWKNRSIVSCKLKDDSHKRLLDHCKANGITVNKALNQIVYSFFNHD